MVCLNQLTIAFLRRWRRNSRDRIFVIHCGKIHVAQIRRTATKAGNMLGFFESAVLRMRLYADILTVVGRFIGVPKAAFQEDSIQCFVSFVRFFLPQNITAVSSIITGFSTILNVFARLVIIFTHQLFC